MRSREGLALLAGAACLVWSASTALQTFSTLQEKQSAVAESETAATRMQTMIARARDLLSLLPASGEAHRDTQPSQARLIENARKAGARIVRISSERGILQVTMSGEISSILKMLDAPARTVTISPSRSGSGVEAEIEYGSTQQEMPGKSIDELERLLAQRNGQARDTVSNRADFATLFHPARALPTPSKYPQLANRTPEGEYIFTDESADVPRLRFLGTISSGKQILSGVFQDERGLVIKAKAGEEVASWHIVKIEESAATITRGGDNAGSIPGKLFRLEQKGIN